ncbi:hypothetical protein J007_06596 [Cryptococcus neoformans]|nr:hypothetical protein J007_06596 [Cryptococcus neoformans var. grubii]
MCPKVPMLVNKCDGRKWQESLVNLFAFDRFTCTFHWT